MSTATSVMHLRTLLNLVRLVMQSWGLTPVNVYRRDTYLYTVYFLNLQVDAAQMSPVYCGTLYIVQHVHTCMIHGQSCKLNNANATQCTQRTIK